MLKLETTWVRPVVTNEGRRPMYTETQQWWGDPSDDSWTHTGYVVVGPHVSRSFTSGFATSYAEQQRTFLRVTGWTEVTPGADAFDATPITLAEIEKRRTAWFAKLVQEEPAA